jgi:hypothetical protein
MKLYIFSLLQNFADREQFLKFSTFFVGTLAAIASYCWFGQQVIDEVRICSYSYMFIVLCLSTRNTWHLPLCDYAVGSIWNFKFWRGWYNVRRIVGKWVYLVRHLQETAWTRYTPIWAERDISRLFFNIVPTDIVAFVPQFHELEEFLLVKVGVVGPYDCFIASEMALVECPLQSREEVEDTGCKVGTVRGAVQALPTLRWHGWPLLLLYGFSHYPTHSYDRLGTAGTIATPFASTWRQDHTLPLDGYGCLPGTHYSVVLSLTQHCAGNASTMKIVRPTTNEEGCLWAQNTVTPHQFYAVGGNKMGKLISRLSYVSP